MKKILFICTGNTCRSSMAEGLFNARIKKEGMSDKYSAFSAGVSALDGECASYNAIKVLKDGWNIDINSHRSRKIGKSDINSSDLILSMTIAHKNAIISIFPEASEKIFTLKEYDMGTLNNKRISIDISDPFGMPLEIYYMCAKEIDEVIDKIILKLKEENS